MLHPNSIGVKNIQQSSLRAKGAQKSQAAPDIIVDAPNSPESPSFDSDLNCRSPASGFATNHYRHHLSRSHTDIAQKLYEIQLYQSYARQSHRDDVPYEAHVQGWIYQPNLNRKGKLIIAAFERLVGNPGKESSIDDVTVASTAAHATTDNTDDTSIKSSHTDRTITSPQSHSGPWINLRPSHFRSRSSKGAFSETPGVPASHTAPNSRPSSPLNSHPNSPQLNPTGLNNEVDSGGFFLPKLTGFSRTLPSPSHAAKKEQKYTIRERMAAVTHKSIAMRDVQIILESEPDETGHTKKRTFWTYSDESGRFGQCCALSFRPVLARVISGHAKQEIRLLYIPSREISVISDIDDTIRHTGVTKSKRELLHNILAKSYDDCRLDGVGEWYQKLADAGAHFHYVSNSPWQLYDVIRGFLDHHHFPEGSIHLKKYAGLLDGLTEPVKGRKRASLERILQDFPHNKFILVGDSGEADLEAYSDVAMKFPNQVLAIYIRDITLSQEEPLTVYDRPTRHRRFHSVDTHSFDSHHSNSTRDLTYNSATASPTTVSSKPPDLPARVRKPLLDQELQHLNITEPASATTPSPTSNRIMSSSESPEFHPRSEEPPLSSPSSNVGSSPPNTSQDSTSSHSGSPARDSQDSPKLPPRPKLLRRTSSKLMEGMFSVASSTTHAAQRLLAPQLPVRPGKAGEKAASGKTLDTSVSGSRTKTPRKIKPSHLANSDSPITAYDSEPNSAPSGDSEYDNTWFIPSSQEFSEFERLVDKRSDSWKIRVMRQQRLLPPSVSLKMWRQPRDVEADSLKIIKENKDLV